ncbi:hypothetical protein Q8004_08210 [Edwardsiella piscicida]|nr:hypothetical protein Q8004_08210 [Edwardsiella piscicida]
MPCSIIVAHLRRFASFTLAPVTPCIRALKKGSMSVSAIMLFAAPCILKSIRSRASKAACALPLPAFNAA